MIAAETVRWRPAEWSAAPPRVAGFYHHRQSAEPGLARLVAVGPNADGGLVARFADGTEVASDGSEGPAHSR